MYRMPYRAMCSRETNRLPVAELQRRLGSQVPNIENGRAASEEPSNPKYFVYYGEPWEFGIAQDGLRQRFALVEVNGLEEHVVEQGDTFYSLSFRMGERPYAKFEGKGAKLGLFAYYCSSPRVAIAATAPQKFYIFSKKTSGPGVMPVCWEQLGIITAPSLKDAMAKVDLNTIGFRVDAPVPFADFSDGNTLYNLEEMPAWNGKLGTDIAATK